MLQRNSLGSYNTPAAICHANRVPRLPEIGARLTALFATWASIAVLNLVVLKCKRS